MKERAGGQKGDSFPNSVPQFLHLKIGMIRALLASAERDGSNLSFLV